MKLYRSRKGIFLGVCQGLSDRTGYQAKYFRAAFIVAALFFKWWALLIYLAMAIFMPVRKTEDFVSAGFRDTFEDIRDDVADFAKREYRDIKDSFKNRPTPEK